VLATALKSAVGVNRAILTLRYDFRSSPIRGQCPGRSACLKGANSGLSRYKKSRSTNGDILVVPASNIMRILLLVFQATPKSHQDDTVFRSSRGWWIFASGPVDQARQAEATERGSFIDLMFPIPFKSLLKYLRRWSLVNFGKLLERKRGGYTHNIGINGL
jgi:hypothetical protein